MMVNHIAHFSLTLRLLPLLRSSAGGSKTGARIINVTSALHALAKIRARDMFLVDEYSSQLAYANSKCAQIMFTMQLRKFEKTSGVHVFAVHPGEVLTTITRGLPSLVLRAQSIIGPLFLLTPEQGADFATLARTCCFPFSVFPGKVLLKSGVSCRRSEHHLLCYKPGCSARGLQE
jgi:NAD(P)-dependent dehydrogenase (short-subunit alcohol dehydrogenase family)